MFDCSKSPIVTDCRHNQFGDNRQTHLTTISIQLGWALSAVLHGDSSSGDLVDAPNQQHRTINVLTIHQSAPLIALVALRAVCVRSMAIVRRFKPYLVFQLYVGGPFGVAHAVSRLQSGARADIIKPKKLL